MSEEAHGLLLDLFLFCSVREAIAPFNEFFDLRGYLFRLCFRLMLRRHVVLIFHRFHGIEFRSFE